MTETCRVISGRRSTPHIYLVIPWHEPDPRLTSSGLRQWVINTCRSSRFDLFLSIMFPQALERSYLLCQVCHYLKRQTSVFSSLYYHIQEICRNISFWSRSSIKWEHGSQQLGYNLLLWDNSAPSPPNTHFRCSFFSQQEGGAGDKAPYRDGSGDPSILITDKPDCNFASSEVLFFA